jgi:hypothetical protein
MICRKVICAAVLCWTPSAAAGLATAAEQKFVPGLIASDAGGVPGYELGFKVSRFSLGNALRTVTAMGWIRMEGTEGVFSASLHNGVVIAVPLPKYEGTFRALMDPDKQNDAVRGYLAEAGIPRDQMADVHATTHLSVVGNTNETTHPVPKIDGYSSILERKVRDIPVPDSVAWVDMDEKQRVIREGVYWPPIPARAIQDALHLKEIMSNPDYKKKYLSRLPAGLPQGKVAIRHSSAGMQQGEFEAIGSYDVLEQRRNSEEGLEVVAIVRHFDVNGSEVRLPQERASGMSDYPSAVKKEPQSSR